MIECDFLKFCLDLFLKAPSTRRLGLLAGTDGCPVMNQRWNLSRGQKEAGSQARSHSGAAVSSGEALGSVRARPWAGGPAPRTPVPAGTSRLPVAPPGKGLYGVPRGCAVAHPALWEATQRGEPQLVSGQVTSGHGCGWGQVRPGRQLRALCPGSGNVGPGTEVRPPQHPPRGGRGPGVAVGSPGQRVLRRHSGP